MLDWASVNAGTRSCCASHRTLLQLRRETLAFAELDKAHLDVRKIESSSVIALRRWSHLGASHAYCLFNFEKNDVDIAVVLPEGTWKQRLDSADSIWNGPGTMAPERIKNNDHVTLRAQSIALFAREEQG
jgi:maltooligosyltrehalose trehalohydrolase